METWKLVDLQKKRLILQWDSSTTGGKMAEKPIQRTGHSIVIAQQKGGVGKSTTACNEAVFLSESGVEVLLIDLGRQLDSYDFLNKRRDQHPELPQVAAWSPWLESARREDESKRASATRARIRAEVKLGTVVVVDCPPVDSEDSPLVEVALLEADVVVTPFCGGGNDFKAFGRCVNMVKMIRDHGRAVEVLAFLNKFVARDNDDAAMAALLGASPAFRYLGEVPRGVEVKRSTAAKLAVWEYQGNNARGRDMKALCSKIATIAKSAVTVRGAK